MTHSTRLLCAQRTHAGTCPYTVPRAEFKPTTTLYEQDGAAQPLTSLRKNVTYNNEMNNFTSMVT